MSPSTNEVAGFEIHPASVSLLPYLFCVNNNVVILGKVDPAGSDPIFLGMANTLDFQTIEILSRKFRNRKVEAIPISNADITRALSLGFQQGRASIRSDLTQSQVEAIQQTDASGERYEIDLDTQSKGSRLTGLQPADNADSYDETAVVSMVDRIMLDATKRGVTDVHIENFEEEVVLRYKIDGLLYRVTSPLNKTNIDQVVSRLKVMSNLDIAEKRLPQDGRVLLYATLRKKTIRVPFRLSILPGPFGEDVVLRVLDKSMAPIDLRELGFSEDTLDAYRRIIRNPQGLVLVTGPTGSGKTTTLYASLKEIQSPHNKILSAEDPIEYTLPGVNQKQVSKYFGFAELARAFLRHDPDILLIGEIRDAETADIAMKAAQTGHLILSTLHTNDSFGAIPRLGSFGVDPTYIATALMGVMSQRLVRRICKYCREIYTPDPEMVEILGDSLHKREFIRGTGCDRCFRTGYSNRIGLFELLNIDQEMQWLIQTGAPEPELRDKAVMSGMRLLLADGLQKVAADETTLEEIFRVIPYRQIVAQAELIRRYEVEVTPHQPTN